MTKNKLNTKKKLLYRLFTIVSLGVFIYAAYGLIDIAVDYYQNRQSLNDVQKTFYEVAAAENIKEAIDNDGNDANQQEQDGIRPKFQELYEKNSDMVGWIKIEDTQIDYPILQANNNENYLTRNFDKDYSIAGSIFMDYRNNIKIDEPNTVVYGHRVKDGTMFEDLMKYKDEAFFESHQTFEYETLYESYEAEIFAAYMTTVDFNYIETSFADDEEFNQFLVQLREKSDYETDIEVNSSDQIITLSTCDYVLDKDHGRMVIHAKLTKK